jgi:streptogramin lyase
MKTRKYTHILDYMFGTVLVFGGMAYGQSRTYTLDADFDEGALLNVNHDAPNNDQLQLNTVTTPFPFVNIACSARGSIVRIDVNTGLILGEYQTAPDGMGRNPSRTTVDQLGNVWVSNRDEFGFSGGQDKGSVARVGLLLGGTRADAAGNPDPGGQYVEPPFQYNTCVDRDGDGLLKTSFGLGNVLLWTNAGGVDTDGGVATAEDECIINYTRVTGTGTRTVAIDANNDVWVGGLGDADHEKLSGVTGQPVAGTQINYGCGGYGGLIDGAGFLWSVSYLRFDTNSVPPAPGSGACLGTVPCPYGIGIDPNTDRVWVTNNCPVEVRELNADGTVRATYPLPGYWGFAQGVAVDGNGHVWAAQGFGAEVAHFAPDPLNPGFHLFVGVVPGFAGTTGVAVDANGKIWASEIGGDSASRIDPNAGPVGGGGYFLGAIDMTVSLGVGAGPYNYSDMTGFVAIGSTSPQGTWTVVYDTGSAGTTGCDASWTSSEPAGTSIGVEVRAADNPADLPAQVFVSVTNGGTTGVTGRYMEIRATLSRDPGVNETPVLYDLTIQCNEPPDCSGASASPAQLWPPNHAFVPIAILGVTDPDGDPIAITIDSIFQDEHVLQSGGGAGNTSPDGTGVGTSTAQVRAERNGNPRTPGDGRVYTIAFTADDGNGGTCEGTVTVCVPHDQRSGASCINGGALYDSTTP